MSDHEDSTASLGCAEVFPVDHSVGDAVPELNQTMEDGGHVPSVVTLEKPFGILDDGPGWAGGVDEPEVFFEESGELEVESAPVARKPLPVRSSDRRVLAGEPPADDVGSAKIRAADVSDIFPLRDAGPVLVQNLEAVGVNLHLNGGRHAYHVEGAVKATYTREDAGIAH